MDTLADRIKLPFYPTPYTVMYHHLAFPLGILQGHSDIDIAPWLCGKYINCRFRLGKNIDQRYNIIIDDPWFTCENVFIFQNMILDSNLRQQLFRSYTQLLMYMLNQGCYPAGNYNEALIPCKSTYGSEYFRHDYLLTGYDKNMKLFHSVGYTDDAHFRFFDIPFDIMEQSLVTLVEKRVELCFWKINPSADFSINIHNIRNDICSYLNSSPAPYIPKDGYSYGLDAHKHLGNYLSFLSPRNAHRDLRYTRGFVEHKFFMHFRMNYLYQKGFLRSYEHVGQALSIYHRAMNTHMLALKFYPRPQQKLLNKMKELVDESVAIEMQYLPLVLSELSDYGDDTI